MHTDIQRCVIHQIRHSLKHISWKDRKAFVADLRLVYDAPTREAAKAGLKALGENGGPFLGEQLCGSDHLLQLF